MADSQRLSTASGVKDGQPPWKKKKLSNDTTSNPSLPYDVILIILARVSRSYYTNLSLVSKSFRSILTSPELYKTRTLLGKTENFLYVCLRFPDEANPRWFTLYRKPNQTLTDHTTKKKKKKKKKKEEKSSVNLLAPISILNSHPVEWSAIISVDHYLYAISADIEKAPYSNVPYLDCRTHTWHEAPRMRLGHTNSEFEGIVYLPGSFESPDSLNCVEVYNTMTQTWKPVPPEKRMFKLENLEKKIYYKSFHLDSRAGKGLSLSYKSKHLTCGLVVLDTVDSYLRSSCMIENIAYFYRKGNFIWRGLDGKILVYGEIEGLEGLPKFSRYSSVQLAEYGGKLVVLWDKYVPASGYKEKMIWCAEISLEKRNGKEIWGNVEWFDAVLTVPKSYKILCATAATL
ncbi:unnamed protein product [Arabidopsis thaliana]|uniref:F-box domain-containing protein n=1 Tax=Arabidopsis thaliana TaxID=3702 RepID=A0A5S9YDG3_ARATH|nr:unnamed protein product [Arabidopsis thaliana]